MSDWEIVPEGSDVRFAVRHFLITTVRGWFSVVEGSMTIDEGSVATAHGEVRVAAAGMSTGSESRDPVLRGEGILEAERHPWLVARLTGVQADGSGYVVEADLTLRGVARPVSLRAGADDLAIDGYPGQRHGRLRLQGTLHRRDWGLHWSPTIRFGGWSDAIEVTVNLALTESTAPGHD